MKIQLQAGLFSINWPVRSTLAILLFLLLCFPVFGDYSTDWYTIDGGDVVCSGGAYVMVGTIGQPDAQVASGGTFVLSGGYWPGSMGCVVNLDDLTIFIEQWLSVDPLSTADFDESGRVDLEDFWELSYWWLDYCPAGWPLK